MAYLEMRGISKMFPGVIANDRIDFSVERGTIHALVGENGAGKSTLMRILYGLYRPDEGEIFIEGEKAAIRSPQDAIRLGIGMVHQEFQLVPSLTVAENIVLGNEPLKSIWVDRKAEKESIIKLSKRFGLHVEQELPIREVPVGVQQRVEILKLLYRQAQLLILDEPTAVLTPQEVDGLFDVLKRLVTEGHTIIFITHKLGEVMDICDKATVLRHGKLIGTVNVADSSSTELARMMVGEDVLHPSEERHPASKEAKLILDDISARGDRGLLALKHVSFRVNAGEVVGIAGVEGNGQSELVEVLTGLREYEGTITLAGVDLKTENIRFRRENGMAIIPESRKTQGLNLLGKVSENLIVDKYYQKPYSAKTGVLSWKRITEFAKELIVKYDIRADGPDAVAGTLSGGNAQKIILARELSSKPVTLIAAHPTRGLDIAATQFVHHEVLHMRAEKVAVLIISADLDELIILSDRILVLFEGRIVGEVDARTVTHAQLGLLMAGLTDAVS